MEISKGFDDHYDLVKKDLMEVIKLVSAKLQANDIPDWAILTSLRDDADCMLSLLDT